MNTESRANATGLMARVLAISGVVCFWALPLSPLIEIAALLKTRRSTGWPRTLAVTGAALCIAWTVMAAVLLAWLSLMLVLRRGFF